MSKCKVFVYGAGHVGRSFARAMEASQRDPDLVLTGAWNRGFARAFGTSRLVDVEVSSGDAIPEAMPKADVILLAVPDDVIASTAALLMRHLKRKQVLLHCSGSLSAEIMRTPETVCSLGCCHPLQALASPEGDPERLNGATCAIEGDLNALKVARRLAEAVGGRPLEIAPEHKALYHAAAVMGANFITVLLDAACQMMAQAKVDRATSIDILLPLLEGTVHQIKARQEEQAQAETPQAVLPLALTGPARRGDAGTIKAHRKALAKLAKQDPQAQDLPALYQALSLRALTLAQAGDLSEEEAQAVAEVLK